MEISLRIALVQINPLLGDLKGNLKKILFFAEEAARTGSDIIVFPELALTGYPPEDLLLKKHFISQNLAVLNKLAKNISHSVCIVGFVDRDQRKNLFNAAAIIQNKKIKGIYHKIRLPNYGVFDEKRYFQVGCKPPLYFLKNIVFGINICEDIWGENNIARVQAEAGAQLLINISASPYYAGKRKERLQMLSERARQTRAYICYCNLVGGQDELVFDGGSFILAHSGKVIARANQFKEEMIFCDLNFRNLKKINCKNVFKLGMPDIIKKPRLTENIFKGLSPNEEIYNALVLGLRDYVKKNNFKTVLIGLSGGIDSTLVATIARDALGNKNVIGLSMPSKYSSSGTQTDARKVAENLGIKFLIVPIGEILSVYLKILAPELNSLTTGVTEENLQARIRGNILMAFSNRFGWLVLATGNKSETSVGYCTLYGDLAGGLAVIKDVPKTLVYELARYFNHKEGREIIPASIFKRPPTAELKPLQKDTDSLPPYPVLDKILKEYVEADKSYEEIIKSGRLKFFLVKEIIEKVDRNEYKRRQSPPGIKITPKAFGRDRRLPITNLYREF